MPELAEFTDRHVICYRLDETWHEMTYFNDLDQAKQSFVKLVRLSKNVRYALFTINYRTVMEYIPEG